MGSTYHGPWPGSRGRAIAPWRSRSI